MTRQHARLSQAFIDRQRARLETERAELLELANDAASEELELRDRYPDDAPDPGDEYANLVQREIDSGLHDVDVRRLRYVERALEKISEGSYGLSDASGAPIPKVRLETVPEAIYTVAEEEQLEAARARLRGR